MRIRELRLDANMTQSQLAEKIGVSTQAVSNYELGKRHVPVSLLFPIKDALGCTWEELFDDENSPANGG